MTEALFQVGITVVLFAFAVWIFSHALDTLYDIWDDWRTK